MLKHWKKGLLFGYISTSLFLLEYPKYSPFANINKNKFVYPKKHKYVVGAHRGGWREYLENSIPAFDNALKQGADFIELDVQITKDK